jgi:hypothetical protein
MLMQRPSTTRAAGKDDGHCATEAGSGGARDGGVADGSDLGSARTSFVLHISISVTPVGNQRGFWP